ncbi:hypothetical protein GCM10025868_15330 [Angustibacter aerolatus]|uniref:PhoD-like phosphatase metallophosphatase domain-containing protein n=1 Tax=Angustibacter aerolatus TaxID=1162965 RepID=A0ABQ6JFS6_9ACTN|nr:hypothetical protein GCM10025868_15330 [Angustibacter aerolatus]
MVASCQNRQDGYYTAWAAAAREDVDLVLFLGDAVYESVKHHGYVRPHSGAREPRTLAEYRVRHGQYRSDGQAQAAHAAHPFVMTPDDHEVDDNWAGGVPKDPDGQSPAAFRRRRDAAMRAYAEHVPARGVPSGRRRERYHRRLEARRPAAAHRARHQAVPQRPAAHAACGRAPRSDDDR